MEMDLGDCEGLRFRELMQCEEDFWKGCRSDPASVKMPSGESLIELQTRAWKVIEGVICTVIEDNVLDIRNKEKHSEER